MTLALCGNCVNFKRNKPKTPIFIKGLWWGGGDAGLCKRLTDEYDSGQHRIDSDGCQYHKYADSQERANCPECGRFMNREKDLEEYVIEHTHNEIPRSVSLTHTHSVFCEVWLCDCGGRDVIEVADDHTEPVPLNTLENTEMW